MCVIRNHPGSDTWPWDTSGQMETVLDTVPAPESRAATSLTGGATATDAEVVSGRFRLTDGDHDEHGHQHGPALACAARS
jgi:hypothetical protein